MVGWVDTNSFRQVLCSCRNTGVLTLGRCVRSRSTHHAQRTVRMSTGVLQHPVTCTGTRHVTRPERGTPMVQRCDAPLRNDSHSVCKTAVKCLALKAVWTETLDFSSLFVGATLFSLGLLGLHAESKDNCPTLPRKSNERSTNLMFIVPRSSQRTQPVNVANALV